MTSAKVNRPMSRMRKIETKEAIFRTRKRILKYLVHAYLRQEGYQSTAESFVTEANLTPDYEVCDNIDLDIILQDYSSYYLMRFNKQPQFCKKVEESAPRRPLRRTRPDVVQEVGKEEPEPDLPSAVTVHTIFKDSHDHTAILPIDKKPLSGFLSNAPSAKRELAEMLYQDILRPSTVTWDDVKGLDSAKSLLMESVVYPVRYPEVFTGLLQPWRGILLHGPPGTGKTLLARALAAESCCTFFNISCSTIVNKWRGESEKIVKVLFEMASYYSPSIIFIDEIETLASERSAPGEHEASRRLKAQLLTELDGIAERDGIVFFMANSNMPWEIDSAMLRRLEKRINIPLPDLKTRARLFSTFLDTKTVEVYPKVDFEELAVKTDGYSGSDIKLVCKEAMMANVRKMLPNMGARGTANAHRKDRVSRCDVELAIDKTKPVSRHLALRHQQWQDELGCS